jgi:DNA-binding CsgD family transcriptional regulator
MRALRQVRARGGYTQLPRLHDQRDRGGLPHREPHPALRALQGADQRPPSNQSAAAQVPRPVRLGLSRPAAPHVLAQIASATHRLLHVERSSLCASAAAPARKSATCSPGVLPFRAARGNPGSSKALPSRRIDPGVIRSHALGLQGSWGLAGRSVTPPGPLRRPGRPRGPLMSAGSLQTLPGSDGDTQAARTRQDAGVSAARAPRPPRHRRRKSPDSPLKLEELFPREREVVELMAAGHSIESTGHQLGISPRTVQVFRCKLHKRFGVNSAIELLLKFYRFVPLPR